MTDEDIIKLAREATQRTVDYDLTGNPITDADVLLMGAFGPLVMRIVQAAAAAERERIIKANATEIERCNEYIKRIQAEVLEQARIIGMGAEREAALMVKVERLERERAQLSATQEENERLSRELEISKYNEKRSDEIAHNNLICWTACADSLGAKLAAHELAIKQLREALEIADTNQDTRHEYDIECGVHSGKPCDCPVEQVAKVIREALSLQPSQEHLDAWFKERIGEPVAWHHDEEGLSYENHYDGNVPLYALDFKEGTK